MIYEEDNVNEGISKKDIHIQHKVIVLYKKYEDSTATLAVLWSSCWAKC